MFKIKGGGVVNGLLNNVKKMHVWYRAASLSLNEIKVKSHLPWIYAHVRGRVKYKVVPKKYKKNV